jgi:hypothetical protein
MLVQFHGLRFDLPVGWADITDDLPEGSPPTLARSSGLGVIQFSIARHRGGINPAITVDGLRRLIADFSSSHALNIGELDETLASIIIVGCVGIATDETVAAWYLTNGHDVILVTYTSSSPDARGTAEELSQARGSVATIEL